MGGAFDGIMTNGSIQDQKKEILVSLRFTSYIEEDNFETFSGSSEINVPPKLK
ncbi:hypothetical protein PI124_g4050 [Phytophthora idaei]|nr:hypothetical protein PI125_g2033 [Phytophthora idaei]KAG3168500.1 hypothetical protein PI126_g3275 [Phytophthora idaei]KAG3251336.1 hypothetical protein PI124_g4050 [Phytophthora idaei]